MDKKEKMTVDELEEMITNLQNENDQQSEIIADLNIRNKIQQKIIENFEDVGEIYRLVLKTLSDSLEETLLDYENKLTEKDEAFKEFKKNYLELKNNVDKFV